MQTNNTMLTQDNNIMQINNTMQTQDNTFDIQQLPGRDVVSLSETGPLMSQSMSCVNDDYAYHSTSDTYSQQYRQKSLNSCCHHCAQTQGQLNVVRMELDSLKQTVWMVCSYLCTNNCDE